MANLSRLGILFVHGIGEQRSGETLATGANAIFCFLDEWLKLQPSPGISRYVRGTIADDRQAPPHVEADITVGAGTHRVIAAEAYWARAFQLPRNSRFLGWLMLQLPPMLARHFGRKAARAWRAGGRWGKAAALAHLATLEAGWLLTPVFLAVLTLLRIAWLIPLPAVRHALERVQVALAATLGDSYAVLDDDVNRIAVVTRVGESLDWLLARCRRVVVVAHSQGAVIAAMTLDERRGAKGSRGRVSRLITYGPGIRKLYETSALRRGGRGPAWAAMVALPLLLVLLWAFSRLMAGLEDATVQATIGNVFIIVLLVALQAAGLMDAVTLTEHPDMLRLPAALQAKGVRWTNIYASHDPVSNGPLFEHNPVGDDTASGTRAPAAPIEEIPVANERSSLFDHNRYWANMNEFVPFVATRVFEGMPGPLGGIVSPAQLMDAQRSRRDLADALVVIRLYVVGAAVLTLAFSSGFVEAWGRSWLGAFARAHAGLSAMFGDDVIPNLPRRLPAYPYEAGVVLLCATAWLLYSACVSYWRRQVHASFLAWLSGSAGTKDRLSYVIALPATIFLFSVIAHERQLGESVAWTLHFVSLIAPAAVLAILSNRRASVARPVAPVPDDTPPAAGLPEEAKDVDTQGT